jgi:hypothetical protein
MSQLNLRVCKNIALAVRPLVLQFYPLASALGMECGEHVGQLAVLVTFFNVMLFALYNFHYRLQRCSTPITALY